MKNALLSGTLELPKKFEAARSRFENIITRADERPPLRDASRKVTVRLNKQVLISPEFLELWDKIKQKTAYRVQIDTEKLVDWRRSRFTVDAAYPQGSAGDTNGRDQY